MNKRKIRFQCLNISKELFMTTKHYHILNDLYDIDWSDRPDFVWSCNMTPDIYKYPCVRIVTMGENLRPDFNLYDYAFGFDDMQFGDRYYHIPYYYYSDDRWKAAREKHLHIDRQKIRDRKFCSVVVSNELNSYPARRDFFDTLFQYKQVDSGGRAYNNIGGPVEDKLAFLNKYKFNIAFENSSTPGYVTEKIMDAFAAGVVPIYWGAPDIAKEFNNKAFINCHQFSSWEEVVRELKRLDKDEDAYMDMLKTPILTEDCFASKFCNDSYYQQCIRSIFDQEPQRAIRRTNSEHGWGAFYERDVQRWAEMNQSRLTNTAYRISHFMHNRMR